MLWTAITSQNVMPVNSIGFTTVSSANWFPWGITRCLGSCRRPEMSDTINPTFTPAHQPTFSTNNANRSLDISLQRPHGHCHRLDGLLVGETVQNRRRLLRGRAQRERRVERQCYFGRILERRLVHGCGGHGDVERLRRAVV